MKNRMVCLLVVLCLIVSMLPGIDFAVNAATSDIWLNFITTRAFEPYLSNASDQEHQEINLEYAVYDVNNDGTTELLIQDEAQRPFFFTWLFAIENGDPQLVYEDYGYGMYRYSNKYNMVIGSAGFRPFSETSEAPFYSLSGTEFTLEFNIVQDLGTGYYVGNGEKRVISEEERISYFEDVIWLDFIPVTELLDDQSGTDPLPTIDNSSDYADDHRVDANQESNNGTTAEDSTINAINALLTGLSYYTQEGDVSQWTDAEICGIIHRKLLDCYDPYLHEKGQSTSSDDYYGYACFELSIAQKITKDAFNREFPVDTKSSHIFVSGEKLIYQYASGESPELAVQEYYQYEDIVIATGTAVYNNNADSEFEGYFQVVLQVNPLSVYGYTLLSFKQIEPNQSFSNISAVASSELVESKTVHGAKNVIDGNLSTVWSEGVPGVGIGEWIKIQTTDGSKMHLSAVDFALGHQKSQEHKNKNGWSPDVLIECEGGYSQKVFFSGMEDCILLDVPVNTGWIKFTILDARAGSKYEDTCISEIILRGIDGASYFREYVESMPPQEVTTDYARTEWIEQHIEYASSDEYKDEIVSGYNDRMLAVFRDALDDEGIAGYRLAKNTSKILGLDFELSETEMYELILAEILYCRTSLNMGTEAYKENYNKALQDGAKLLVTVANVADGTSKIPKDALKRINELYSVLNTLSTDSPDFDATYSQFVKLIKENVSEPDLIKGFKSDATFTAIGIVVDGLFATYESLEDILQYMNNYIAYQSTSRQLKEVLMRLSVVVLYEYEGLYGVEELEELDIWDAMVNWGDFSAAVVSFMTVLADYEQEGAAAVAEYAIERAKEGGQKFGDKAFKSVFVFGLDTVASKVPVLNAIVLAKNVLNVGVLVTEVLTNVDEREYALDMLTKIYCISVALDRTVDDCADAMNENDFYTSTVFDESVNVYSGNLLLASDFALKYADMVLANAEEDLYNYDKGWGIDHLFHSREKMVAIVEWYSNSYKLLEAQKNEIQSIACHDSDLAYNQLTDEIIYNFKDSRIYVVACPVDVIVTTDTGEQIAYLSGENNQIASDYEFYFHTIKLSGDSGEYIKVAIVPDEYQIEMKGTDDGVMNAFVADFSAGDVGEVETYFNIPIKRDSVGHFETSSSNKTKNGLVMDQISYSNMETVDDIPTAESVDDGSTASRGNGLWILIGGGVIICGVIFIVVLKKKS